MCNIDLFCQVLLDFYRDNYLQIKLKAKYYNLSIDDIKGELAHIYYEKGKLFNKRKRSLAAFLFGHLEKKLRRRFNDALYYAVSIDDNSESGKLLRETIESTKNSSIIDDKNSFGNFEINSSSVVVGASNLASLADAVSGKSTAEIGKEMRLSRRRVNQLILQYQQQAKVQSSFDFFDGENHGR